MWGLYSEIGLGADIDRVMGYHGSFTVVSQYSKVIQYVSTRYSKIIDTLARSN